MDLLEFFKKNPDSFDKYVNNLNILLEEKKGCDQKNKKIYQIENYLFFFLYLGFCFYIFKILVI